MILKVLKKSWTYGLAIASFLFAIVPESCFSKIKVSKSWPKEWDIVAMRLIICAVLIVSACLIYWLYIRLRHYVTVSGKNYKIKVEYGDILREKKGKKLISFDECFTTKVGSETGEINAASLCGKYLNLYPMSDEEMKNLLKTAGLKSLNEPSRYKSKTRYKPGSMILKDSYLLMAFTKLDENGRSSMNYNDYLDCLSVMWKDIDDHYGQEDVYIPVLGAGTTKFEDWDPDQQELLNVIIESYKLSRDKIKLPCKLHIVCSKRDGFSLNNIDMV